MEKLSSECILNIIEGPYFHWEVEDVDGPDESEGPDGVEGVEMFISVLSLSLNENLKYSSPLSAVVTNSAAFAAVNHCFSIQKQNNETKA